MPEKKPCWFQPPLPERPLQNPLQLFKDQRRVIRVCAALLNEVNGGQKDTHLLPLSSKVSF